MTRRGFLGLVLGAPVVNSVTSRGDEETMWIDPLPVERCLKQNDGKGMTIKGEDDKLYPVVTFPYCEQMETLELGFRDDGVVVWRRKKK